MSALGFARKFPLSGSPRSKRMLLVALSAILGSGIGAPLARADSFWDHNGSLMRLRAAGNARVLEYETPSSKMKAAGVEKGTVLFEGARQGNRYSGTARVFSHDCSAPLEYGVAGYVATERHIVLAGRREVYGKGCRPSGRFTEDTLEFSYVSSE